MRSMTLSAQAKRALVGVAAAVAVLVVAILVYKGLIASPARYNRNTQALGIEEFLGRYEWLRGRLDKWQETAAADAKLPTYSDLAAYPVGNGRAFAIAGLEWPLDTITNLIGPTYQKEVGFFGSLSPWLSAAGKPVNCPNQSVEWASQAPIAICRQATDDGLALNIYYCAVPDTPAIVFVASVVNNSKTALRHVSLMLSSSEMAGKLEQGRLVIDRKNARMAVGIVGARPSGIVNQAVPLPKGLDKRLRPMPPGAKGVTVAFPLGTFRPAQSVVKLGYVIFTRNRSDENQWVQRIASQNFALLDTVHEAWQKRLASIAAVSSGDRTVDQFFTAALYILLSQQAEGGGFSPMHGYTYLWVRDSNGPIRYLSAVGDGGDVSRALEYHFRACAVRKVIGNNVPLNMKLPSSLVQPDWSKVPVEPAEVPSFIILQHYWYYASTGDLTLIKWHWPMLVRCLLGQDIDSRGALPFHGDETYRFPGYELFAAGHDITDWVCLETMSADSAFEYVAAAKAMVKFAAALGKTKEAAEFTDLAKRIRAATEALYWQPDRGIYAPSLSSFTDQIDRYPFANIDLRPLWIGYGDPTDPRQQKDVLDTIKYLAKPDGLLRSTPACGYYVGMLPGYTLYDLAELRHPAARTALAGLLRCAERSGGYSEMVAPDDKPASEVWGLHRARPWETGINAEAVLHALTGYRPMASARRAYLRPLLLAGSPLAVQRLPLGSSSINFRVSEDKGVRHYHVTISGVTPARAVVDLSVVVWGTGLQVQSVQSRNGGAFKAVPGPKWPWAQEVLLPDLPLDPEHPIDVTVTYKPSATGPAWFKAVPFSYGPAKPPVGAKALLFTGSAAQAKAKEAKVPGLKPVDTSIPWPAEYLRSLLLPGGRPSVPLVILDVARYPGAFKRPSFWTTGAGGQILKAYEAAGGKVQSVARPSPPPTSRQGFAGAVR